VVRALQPLTLPRRWAGFARFPAAPLYGLAFGALYAGGGIVILLSLTALGMIYLAYPLQPDLR